MAHIPRVNAAIHVAKDQNRAIRGPTKEIGFTGNLRSDEPLDLAARSGFVDGDTTSVSNSEGKMVTVRSPCGSPITGRLELEFAPKITPNAAENSYKSTVVEAEKPVSVRRPLQISNKRCVWLPFRELPAIAAVV